MTKYTRKLSIVGLLVALTYPALTAGFTVSAKAEQTEPAIVNSKNISVIKQSPKTFESFALKDPETGAAITADKMLTLPDGRQVKAGEFYAELNRVEQNLSAQGYSLRDNIETRNIQDLTGRDTANFAAQIQKQEQLIKKIDPGVTNQIRQKFDRSSIQQELLQHEKLEQQLVKPTTPAPVPGVILPRVFQTAPIRNIESEVKDLTKIDRNLSTQVIDPRTRTIDPKYYERIFTNLEPNRDQANSAYYYGNLNYEWGDRGRFSAYINGKLDIHGDGHTVKTDTEANAGGYVFNKHANVLRATANISSPDNGDLSARLNLQVFGDSVYNPQFTAKKIEKSDQFEYSLDRQLVNYRTNIGPIPVSATFGVRGSAGIRYNLSASSRYASAQVVPYLNTQVYGQGGADIIIGGGGVGANLTLINDELDIAGKAQIRTDYPNKKIYLDTALYAYNKIDALKGNVYLYAYTYVPRFGLPPWEKKQINQNIWNWTGLHNEGYLFNFSKTATLL
jgi:hypothetical protein